MWVWRMHPWERISGGGNRVLYEGGSCVSLGDEGQGRNINQWSFYLLALALALGEVVHVHSLR